MARDAGVTRREALTGIDRRRNPDAFARTLHGQAVARLRRNNQSIAQRIQKGANDG